MSTTTPTLETLLSLTLSFESQSQAEMQLKSLHGSPGFPLQLLQLSANPSLSSLPIKTAALLYYKNLVKSSWDLPANDPLSFSQADKDQLKDGIVSLMVSLPPNLQVHVSEAISVMALYDFPDRWNGLIGDLLSRLSLTDYVTNLGVLKTIHSILKRWRSQVRSNELFTEIKFVLDQFAAPYLAFFQETDKLIDANGQNLPALKLYFETLFVLLKIFFSLNCHDLPEFFEDHLSECMTLFKKYLEYNNPLLDLNDSDEPGPIEKVKASICEIIDLFASKYEEDFKQLSEFVQVVWNVLTGIGLEPKNDYLVSKAIGFLTSVVKPARHKSLFDNPETQSSICSMIICPNMMLRDSDIELFEDDPIEFIRRDLEGSDSETRRAAASQLVRGLLDHFAKEITDICSRYIHQYLQEYEKDKTKYWRSKDSAMYLLTSLSAKAFTVQHGATQINEFVEILPVFSQQVVPDLQSPLEGPIHPIVKVDAIKYLLMFRGQFTKDQLSQIFPFLSNHLESKNYVVHTYAAICMERILSLKINGQLMFKAADIAAIAGPMLSKLFDLIESQSSPAKLAENDYLMKTIMRLVIVLNKEVGPHTASTLSRLTRIISVISSTPSNPKFNHYAFETMASLVRFSCTADPSQVVNFESFLFPPFQEILQSNVEDFRPYVFQILSMLLSFHLEPGLPEQYMQMLPFFLAPALWESLGNIPALVCLFQSYLAKGSKEIIEKGHLTSFLGVSHRLLSSKLKDHYGFELLTAIFEYIPSPALQPFAKNVFVALLTRLMQNKTEKFTTHFLNFCSFLFVVQKESFGIDDVIGLFDSIQATPLFNGVLQGVIIPGIKENVNVHDLLLVTVGFTNLLTQSKTMLSEPYFGLWPQLLEALLIFMANPLASSALTAPASSSIENELEALEQEDVYQANYAKLSTMGNVKKTYTGAISDPRIYLTQSLARLSQSHPGKLDSIIKMQLSMDSASFIRAFAQEAGFPI